ncbi:hypothetical protein [Halorussus marinus]|uniref:hypothetical protein n=1 Tax=Halorussus marinus TaxID=2505976 RepID=UPI00106DE9AE|nr:hypothetical protein [Halorussus marinus]
MASDTDEDVPDVPIVCSECETTSRVPLPELEATLARHNDRRHGGDPVAEVDPDLADTLADLVAEDLQLLDE